MLHQWFYKKCKVLIFSVYFCGARCSYIYIYSCTLHQPLIPIRTGNFFLFSRVGYFRLPVLERKAKSEAWLYEGIAMLVRISDTPFFIDDAVNAFLHGIVAVVIPVRDIKACGMAVA